MRTMGRAFGGLGGFMLLLVGQRVPVAYLPDDPARTTTVHWAKVPTRG
ncbi:hypothetical protein [Meiothermus sp. CFH 77666]|nr:hypothetical protein [Meiothermus sp. CFH 77666]MBO1437547.1 hypothetical protein [Meiothermus sp. CFH 77666]